MGTNFYFYDMNILTLSGSSRSNSSNVQLLESLSWLMPKKSFLYYRSLHLLPLFQAEQDAAPWSAEVIAFRKAVAVADAVIISTPEYIHNMPAQLKNALEWLTSSGELVGKAVLPITYTPHEPRGERAMQSLLWCLEALDARVVTSLSLYQNSIKAVDGRVVGEDFEIDLLRAAVELL